MDLTAALAYLDAHVNLEARAGRIEGLSLERIERLLHVMGDPQDAFKAIHVTGTNGKGSVTRMVTALLVESGLSVGTYTSPHLERVNERLAWNLEPVDDETLARLIAQVADAEALAGVEPSYFEILTAAAFTWFAEIAVDVAVVEVGLLGRFDATNVVSGDVAVITNVGHDHTDGVGDWRERIASEKAGIIKAGSVVVLGEADPGLRAIFEGEPHLAMFVLGEDFDVIEDMGAVGGHLISLRTPAGTLDELFVPMHGSHQVSNAALVVSAVEAFFARPLDEELARAAFAGLSVPGRFEVLGHEPLVVVDGAHNPEGAAAFAQTFEDEFDVAGRVVLVVGLLQGRDPAQVLELLGAGRADLVVACAPPSPRAIPAAEVAAAAAALGAPVEVAGSVSDAVDRALAVATFDDAVLITGSLYVAGAARAHLAGSPGRGSAL